MNRIISDIRQGIGKRFVNAICNGNNDVVLEYLKNGMSATKECMGEQPMFYAINHNNFGAILEKDYLEECKENFRKEALDFLASMLK